MGVLCRMVSRTGDNRLDAGILLQYGRERDTLIRMASMRNLASLPRGMPGMF